jgi:hypothetical protein
MPETKASHERHSGSSFVSKDVVELIVEENCKRVVEFGSVHSKLPQIVSNANSLVKVTSKFNGNFYAMSEIVLNRLIGETMTRTPSSYSFFDDMDTFISSESIGVFALDKAESLASEYSESDIKTLHKIAK